MVARMARYCRVECGRFVRSEDGPAGAEYAILLALLVLSSMAIVQSIGSKVWVIYEHIRSGVADAVF